MNTTGEAVSWIMKQEPPHRGFGFLVRENEWGLWLIVSLEELSKYSHPQQEDLATWLGWLVSTIRSNKIPCYIARKEDDERNDKR